MLITMIGLSVYKNINARPLLEEEINRTCPPVTDDARLNAKSDSELAFSADLVTRNGDLLELEGNAQIVRQGNQYIRAQHISLNQSRGTIEARNVIYTRCPAENRVWQFKAKHIHINDKKNSGVFRHGVLYFYKVPIFYLPIWWFVPDKNRRATQFLPPKFDNDEDDGFGWVQQFFINLAPHYDLTLGMHFIEERGPAWHMDFNYNKANHVWRIYASDLERDRAEERLVKNGNDERREALGHRGLYHLSHYSANDSGLSFDIDYSKLTDPYYGEDFDFADIVGDGTSYVAQRAALRWQNPEWNIIVRGSSDQAVNNGQALYRIVPSISMDYTSTGRDFHPEYTMKLRYAQLDHPDTGFSEGERIWANVGLAYPMHWSGFSLRPAVHWRSVRQTIKERADYDASTLGASIDARLRFERARGEYAHTLEAKLFYLYHRLRSRQNPTNFNTRALEFSAEQVFRDTRFSGYDYLDDTEHLGVGISGSIRSRQTGAVILRGSVNQIFYARDREVNLDGEIDAQSNSPLVTTLEIPLNERFTLDHEISWNTDTNDVDAGTLGFNYVANRYQNALSLQYRYDRRLTLFDENVSQLRLGWTQQYSTRWHSIVTWGRDLENNWDIYVEAKLEYRGCCFSVAINWEREQDNGRESSYSYGISLGL